MRNDVLAVLAIAVVANAHWTHDDSLAREIGPPPGEEDIDVASLSDELISTGVGSNTLYRITIGTRKTGNTINEETGDPNPMHEHVFSGSNHNVKVSFTGADGVVSAALPLRYYQGTMSWEDAYPGSVKKLAPELHPGMVPLITGTTNNCGNGLGLDADTFKPLDCAAADYNFNSAEAMRDLMRCEPNTKACQKAIEQNKVGYVHGVDNKLQNTHEDEDDAMSLGIIQRGQISMPDVGAIAAVEFTEDVPGACTQDLSLKECSSPWAPLFAKINTNNPQTGIGNGVYYIQPFDSVIVGTYTLTSQSEPITETVIEGNTLKAKPALPTATGFPDNVADPNAEFNAILSKCIAQTCEEEMDTKLRMNQMMEV